MEVCALGMLLVFDLRRVESKLGPSNKQQSPGIRGQCTARTMRVVDACFVLFGVVADLFYPSQIAKFMGPTWDPPGSCRHQMGPMLAPWTLLSGISLTFASLPLRWWCPSAVNIEQWGLNIAMEPKQNSELSLPFRYVDVWGITEMTDI